MLGDNLLTLIKAYRYQGVPSPMVRKLVRHVALALDFLHTNCRVIHTDLKPENVLLTGKVRRGVGSGCGHAELLRGRKRVQARRPTPTPPLPRSCPLCPCPPRSWRARSRWRSR